MQQAVIVGAARTPIGAYLGCLRDVPAYRLAALAMTAALERARLTPERVDEVILAQSYQNGENVNVARVGALAAGWPVSVPGITLDRRCCGGLDVVRMAALQILAGDADIVVAGGVETMSRAEFYIPGEFMKWGVGGRNDEKWGFMPRGHGSLSLWGIPLFDRIARARVMSQPVERFGELNSMMSWAEAAAKAEGITREAADRWAVRSHQRAVAAQREGRFDAEIVPVSVPQARGADVVVDRDEPPRADTSVEKLAKLKPVYADGICTAGNSSTENDGAAAVVLASAATAARLGLRPLASVVSFAVAADDPTLTYPAVPASVTKALHRAGLSLGRMDLVEIQEAFAAQMLADAQLMGLSETEREEKLNVNGSGISLGHPISATGVMRLVTLLHEMERRKARYGLETICGGGGHGIAAVFRRGE